MGTGNKAPAAAGKRRHTGAKRQRSSSFILHPSSFAAGFTLVELLVAMSIIAILVGLLFISGKHLFAANKTGSTKVILASLKGMLAEFDSKTRMATAPQQWLWAGQSMPVNSQTSGQADVDFWKIPWRNTNITNRNPDALDAPGLMGSDNDLVRNASRQVLNTQLAMNILLSYPANRTALQQIPPEKYMTPAYSGGSMPAPDPSNGVLYVSGAGGTEPVLYPMGAKVQYNGKRFVCINTNGVSSPTAPGSDPSAGWTPDLGPACPVILDAWNNPIIFVPATGLRVRKHGDKPDNDPKTPDMQTMIIVSPEGKVDYTNAAQPKVVQTGRPFFASAGPDGDFAKGDDNIYSFDQQ